MARYTGPVQESLVNLAKIETIKLERRNYPPGQHGMAKKRGKI
jgi:hypothetical protein